MKEIMLNRLILSRASKNLQYITHCHNLNGFSRFSNILPSPPY